MQRLHAACHEGDSQLVSKLINPDSINKKDEAGLTPICYAAKAGHTEIVQLLIRRGADLSGASSNDLRTNVIYQICQCPNANKQLTLLKALFHQFGRLTFTDGTQKHHLQLAINLILNYKAAVLDLAIFNKRKDRLANWIKANYFKFVAATLLSDTKSLDKGEQKISADMNEVTNHLEKAIDYFERFNASTDQELNEYIKCLRALLKYKDETISNDEKKIIFKKIFKASGAIQNRDSQTSLQQTFSAFNLAQTYWMMENREGAKKYFQIAIEHTLSTPIDSEFFLDNLPNFLTALKLCFPKNSPMRSFYEMTIECLLPDTQVNNQLLDLLHAIAHQTNTDADMIIGITILIKILRHAHNLDLLSNKALKELMDQPITRQCMDVILDLIEYQPTTKEEVEAVISSPKNTFGQNTQQYQHLVFFTASSPASGILDINITLNEMKQTHSLH